MEEIWKDIKNYEGLYQISNLGNVKSVKRYRNAGTGNYLQKEKIISQFDVRGYKQVRLCKDKKYKNFSVHRLVAKAFIPNTEEKEQVNHINGIKSDNRLDNLEWCTQSENQIHAYRTGLQKPIFGRKSLLSKPVNQFDLKGNFIKKFCSMMEAERETGIEHSNISRCCSQKGK